VKNWKSRSCAFERKTFQRFSSVLSVEKVGVFRVLLFPKREKIEECKETNDNLIFVTVGIFKGIHMNFIEIQSYNQIPAVAYFCSCFSSSFKLPSFDIEVSFG
jgi:hypothetical protein